jgi:hypothetical protein
MNITTTYKTNGQGRSQILAKGMGRQKTISFDASKSSDWNHGTAAGALIIHVNSTLHPLERQNGDDLRRAAVRSIDGGYSTHDSNESGTVHRFVV